MTDTASFKHRTQIQVRYNDIDILNHVNNAVYQQYLDMAKYNYFKQVLKGTFSFENYMFVLAHLEINFTEPIVLGEDIVVLTKTINIGEKSLRLRQLIFENKKERVKAVADSVMVAYNKAINNSLTIDNIRRQMIMDFEK